MTKCSSVDIMKVISDIDYTFVLFRKEKCKMGRKKAELLKGSIRKRGKKFQVIVPYKDMQGEWKQKTKTCGTMEEAVSTQKKINNDITIGISMDDPKFSQVAEMYIAEVKLSNPSSNTIAVYKHCTEFITDRLGDKKVSGITRTDVVKLYTDIKEQNKEPKMYRAFLNLILNRAVSLKFISENVAKDVQAERTNEIRPPKILNVFERQLLIENAPDDIMRLIIELDFNTGLRAGELFGLYKSEINMQKGSIEIKRQRLISGEISTKLKSKLSYRKLFLDKETIDIIRKLLTLSVPEELELIPDGFYHRGRLTRYLRTYDMIPHDLRHNHATDLLDICNSADASTRMGHKTEEYIKTYVHTSDDKQKAIADKMDEMHQLCDNFVTERKNNVTNLLIPMGTEV